MIQDKPNADSGRPTRRRLPLAVRAGALALLATLIPPLAHAYVGPGAGFAVVGSLGILFVTFLLGFFALLTWPFRAAYRAIRSRMVRRKTDVKRVLILGLDGVCPKLATRWMRAGHLPNLKKLADTGSFKPLASAVPPMSPVAWSSFATGVDASKHNIFDFLNRDLRSYLPVLSSTDIRPPVRTLKIGRFEIPISKPMVRLLRKSRSFWRILGEHLVSCHVIRVPITFPPEPLPNGALLAAMCVPDLRGTQGSFTFFTSDKERAEAFEGGTILHVEPRNDVVETEIPGPPDPLSREHNVMALPLRVEIDRAGRKAKLTVGKETIDLPEKTFSDWVPLQFKASLGQKVKGIVRFRIMEIEPHFNLYMTAINMDPEGPAMPISSPGFFAQYLARLQGPYATLGLAEDTWALNERVIDEETFLELAMLIHEEREKMWFNSLNKNTSGLNAIVFDATDRIQHMFYRYLEQDHPANHGKDTERYKNAILDIYKRCDDLVGRTMKHVDDKTVLFVISDHGFAPFKRGINLNSWLLQNGYFASKNGHVDRYFDGADWDKTKAYTFGLTGIYINLKGRDSHGIVDRKGEYQALKQELIEKLSGLRDPETGEIGILRVFDAEHIYHGPYRTNGPDLVIGYNRGYRASWDAAVGIADDVVFGDNTKSWGGDHCMDPAVVPGVVFCNRKIHARFAALKDMGPSTLDLLGVPIPPHMDGIPLLNPESADKRASMADAFFKYGMPDPPKEWKSKRVAHAAGPGLPVAGAGAPAADTGAREDAQAGESSQS